VAHVVPGVAALRSYQRRWLHFDLVAGLVLAAILVPQGMAYAELAGLPPVNGLYTTIACLVGYAIMGPSRILVLGPDSSLGPLIFAAIAPLVVAGDDPGKAVALAGMLALLVGLIEIGLGVARLGFVADLLSKEVQVGYMNGLAITIVVGQLPKLCGFSTDADGFVDELRAFVDDFGQRDRTTIVLGLTTLAVLLVLPRISRRIPAVLVAVVGATLVTAVFDLDVKTVGAIPQGLPRPTFPWTSAADVIPLLVAAAGITLVSLTDTIATSTSFAARRGDEVDSNQEMIGLGTANLASGVFQGFAVSTSGSRTAVAEQAGAKSQLTGLVGAACVALLLLFFSSLLADLPQTALAAIVISAAISLADVPALARFARTRRTSFALSLAATAGVLLFRWEAPLFFANSGLFRQQVRRLIRERQPRWVVLQCEAITDIDVTAADMLERLDLELNAQGIHMAFVELRTRLHDLVYRYGLFETLDHDHFYGTIDDALLAIRSEEAGESTSTPD
jgi:high affinity sulfate transporter 1